MAAALKQQEKTLWFGGLAGVLAIVIGALLVHVVTRRILMSVAEAVRVATALAEGDLGVAPRVRRADEIGQLLDAMDKARLAWIAAIGEIHIVTTHNPFAVNDLWLERELGVAQEHINPYGCSLVYGHPQAPTGARAIAELIEALALRGGGLGLFTGCAAGDTGAAVIVKVDA